MRDGLTRSVVLLCLCGCLFMATAGRAAAAESEGFQRAYAAYVYGEYKDAAEQFHALLYPLTLTSKEEILKAHQYLGICYYILDEKIASENEFRSILRVEPGYALDPLFTPPEIVTFFQGVKDQVRRETRLEVQRRRTLFALNFVPFGVGQFQNGQKVKGYVLLGTEGTALLTNILAYYARKTMETSPNHYQQKDLALATGLQDAQLAAFWILVGAGVYGIVDAIWNFSPGPAPAPIVREAPGG